MGGERGSTTSKRLAGEARDPVYMSFFLSKGWYCQFLEADLKTPLPRKLTFATPDKVRELVERGGGIRTTEDRQAFEYALTIGRGGFHLNLTREQYAKPSQLWAQIVDLHSVAPQ